MTQPHGYAPEGYWPPVNTQPPAKKRRKWPWILGIVGAFLFGIGFGAALGSDGEVESAAEAETVVEEVEVEVEPADIEDRRAELDERESDLDDLEETLSALEVSLDERESELAEAQTALDQQDDDAAEYDPPVADSGSDDDATPGQRNALRSAESYLSFTAFSREGLISQLQFEDYSRSDAEYAVDHVTVDWNEQAVKSAESYLSYTSFSLQGLIDQLVFEGFTREQAEHGANAAY